jgi:Tol biopolymer transport system component
MRENPIMPSAISPDGQLLAQSGNPMTRSQVSALSIRDAGDSLSAGKRTPLLDVPGIPMTAISPDGHWIAYSSNENGQDEIYVQPFAGPGEKVVISAEGGELPTWSPKGRELFYLSTNRIMVVNYAIKEGSFRASKGRSWSQQSILGTGGPYQPYALAPDGKRFAVMLYPDGTAERRNTLSLTYVLNFTDILQRRLSEE